jgi:hypothetical protein
MHNRRPLLQRSNVTAWMYSMSRFVVLTLLLGFGIHAGSAWAATYYVDPVSGSDANPGTSQTSAWRTLPGTRTASDSGYVTSAWGSITSSNKIRAGDTIYLKAGTSHTSANGGRIVFDSTYYSNGTSASPISVRVSPSWGTGNFTINGTGMSIPTYFGMLFIKTNYLTLSGADVNRRLVVKNASVSQGYNILVYGSSGTHSNGVVIDYADVSNGPYGNIGVGYSDNGIIRNSLIHDSKETGIQMGLAADIPNTGWTLQDLDVYNNGQTTTGMENLPHGVQIVGSFNVTVLRVKSHGNRRDGFDFGSAAANNNGSMSAVVVDSTSYNNGEDGFGCNGGTGVVKVDYVNVISFNNGASGWQIYDGPTVGIYNSIAHSNGNGSNFGGNILTYTDSGYPPPQITLRNNIFYKPKRFAQIGSYNSPGGNPVINSDYNIYVPRSSDGETGFDYPWGTYRNYTSPPAFIGPHDKLGLAYDPGFVASASTTNFDSNNYHPSSASSSVSNAGVALPGIPQAAKDRDGHVRGNPPDIGPYEYGNVATLAPPLPPSLIQ